MTTRRVRSLRRLQRCGMSRYAAPRPRRPPTSQSPTVQASAAAAAAVVELFQSVFSDGNHARAGVTRALTGWSASLPRVTGERTCEPASLATGEHSIPPHWQRTEDRRVCDVEYGRNRSMRGEWMLQLAISWTSRDYDGFDQ